VLAEMPGVRLVSLDGRVDELLAAGILTAAGRERLRDALTANGGMRLLPGRFQTDGFFIAQMERTA